MGEQMHYHPREEEQNGAVDTELPVVESEIGIDDIDKMLAEIDSVLEENPEEFVQQYQQRGGQ